MVALAEHSVAGAVRAAAESPATIVVSGNIEAHESVLSFTQVQAPIVELAFDEGATVAKDTVLARVDDSLYRRQIEIDHANLGVATAQVAVNESTLAAAQSNVSSDGFDLVEKQRDYARAEELVKTNAISIQGRDLAFTAARQSAAALAHDQAMVQVATTNVDLGKANQAAVASKLALDEVTLGYTTLRAPFAGVISVREAELGQLAGPGVAIFTLDDLDHVWLRAYVNEPDIGKVRLNRAGRCDDRHLPGQDLPRPHQLHFAGGGIHPEDRRDARRTGDAGLSDPHRYRQSDARAAAGHAGRRQHRRSAARPMTRRTSRCRRRA